MIDWKKLLSNSWMTNSDFLSASAHIFSAFSITLLSAYLWGHIACVVVAVLLMVYAGVKEFWYDANYEYPAQTTKDNVVDFITYLVGVVLALLVVFLKH